MGTAFRKHDGLAPGCVECETCGVVVGEDETDKHECWCLKCRHPKGPIGVPRGIIEDGYRPVWVCPCDCHERSGA